MIVLIINLCEFLAKMLHKLIVNFKQKCYIENIEYKNTYQLFLSENVTFLDIAF